MPYNFWEWEDPEEKRKRDSEDFSRIAQGMLREADGQVFEQNAQRVLNERAAEQTASADPWTRAGGIFASLWGMGQKEEPSSPPAPKDPPSLPESTPEESAAEGGADSFHGFTGAADITKPLRAIGERIGRGASAFSEELGQQANEPSTAESVGGGAGTMVSRALGLTKAPTEDQRRRFEESQSPVERALKGGERIMMDPLRAPAAALNAAVPEASLDTPLGRIGLGDVAAIAGPNALGGPIGRAAPGAGLLARNADDVLGAGVKAAMSDGARGPIEALSSVAEDAVGGVANHIRGLLGDEGLAARGLTAVGDAVARVPVSSADIANAAGGAVMGSTAEVYQAQAEGRDINPENALRNAAIGGAGMVGLGRLSGRFGGTAAGARAGAVPSGGGSATRAAATETITAKPITLTREQEISRIRLDKFPEEVRPLIQNAAEDIDWARDQRRGVIPDEMVQQMAAQDLRSVDQIITRGKPGRAYNAEETQAIRNAVTGQASLVRDLAEQVADARANNVTPDLLIARQYAEGLKLQSLVKVAEGARAEAGRTLRAYRQYAQLIEQSPEEAIQRIYRKAGGSDEAIKLVDTFHQIEQSGNVIDLAKFWANVESPPVGFKDWFLTLRYNSMLSGPATHLVNLVSNAFEVPWRLAGETAEAIGRGRVNELAPMYRGVATGLNAGLHGAWQTLTHGISEAAVRRGDLPRDLSTRLDNPLAKGVALTMEAPMRGMAAGDEFFHQLNYHMKLGQLAARQGGDAAGTARLLADPTKEMMESALKFAERATFHGDMGSLGNRIQQLRQVNPVVGNIVMPFLTTVYHITGRGIDRSPLGLAAVAKDLGLDALDRLAGREGKRVAGNIAPLNERVRDGLLGTVATALAANWAASGQLSGAGPSNAREKAQLQAQGWQPYSVKIGDQWVSYANLGPAAIPLAMAAAWGESIRYAKPDSTPLDQWGDMVKRFAEVFTEQTYLQGFGNLYRSITDPERYGGQFITSLPQTMVPFGSAINALGQSQDPVQRRPQSANDVGLIEGTRQQMANRSVPFTGGRDTVPTANDLTGQPIPNPRAGADAINPFRVSQERPSAAITELGRVGLRLSDVGDKLRGEQLSPDEAKRYRDAAQANRVALIEATMAAPYYREADDETKRRLLERAQTRGAAWAAQDLRPDRNAEGNEWLIRAVAQDRGKAVAGYVRAMGVERELQNERAQRYGSVYDEQETAEIAQDKQTLQAYRSTLGLERGSRRFGQEYGFDRLRRAQRARETESYKRAARKLREDADYMRFIASAPRTIRTDGVSALVTEDEVA